MKKMAAILPVLVILATSLPLPGFAAEELQGGAAAPEGMPGAVTLSGETPGDEHPEGLVHTVVAGDTLWDLSARYLGSPWLWPELWQRNRFLTNPHYIYPGIRVEVFPPSSREYVMEVRGAPPSPPAASTAPEAPAQPVSEKPKEPVAAKETPLAIPQLEYVRAGRFLPQRPEGIGNIRSGIDSRVAFSERDKVFLSLDKEIPPGQLLGVFRVRGPVGPPSGSSVSGYVQYLVGILQVQERENGKVAAVVRKSFEDLSRSDQILEEIPGYDPVMMRPGEDNLEAVVLAGRSEHTEFATGHVVYLDKGTDAGVAVGNLFRVFTGRKEATWGTVSGGDDRAPVEVARVVVVRTLPGSSSAYIVSGTQSFPSGASARRGTGSGGAAGSR